MVPDKMLAELFESPLQHLEQRLPIAADMVASICLGPVLPAWAVIASAALGKARPGPMALLWLLRWRPLNNCRRQASAGP